MTPNVQDNTTIESWLDFVRIEFENSAPELLDLFVIYANEAKFGREYIDSDLAVLPPSANILEVGAGSLLLSCQLIREGFQIVSLEPVGNGFSHFDRMRNVVLKAADNIGLKLNLLNATAESLSIKNHFDYAFSVNVMEHVDDVSAVVVRVGDSLREAGIYRFTCPNYLFPYEPHFNIPTFFSKRITEKLFYNKIFGHKMPDPKGTWESLNWITVSSVRKIIVHKNNLSVKFNRSILSNVLTRVVDDKVLASRRSPFLMRLIWLIVFLRIHLLLKIIPASLQPVMDCVITKYKKQGNV
ncbi:class I SAM-dependent methyltransferase [Eionea flava]